MTLTKKEIEQKLNYLRTVGRELLESEFYFHARKSENSEVMDFNEFVFGILDLPNDPKYGTLFHDVRLSWDEELEEILYSAEEETLDSKRLDRLVTLLTHIEETVRQSDGRFERV